MSSTTTRSQIGSDDLKQWDGKNRTFTRLTSTGGTLTLNAIGTEVDVLEAFGGGTQYTDSAISDAIAYIGATSIRGLLLQPGTWVIDANLSISSNYSLIAPEGVVLSVATGCTLTINGPLIAGRYTIFSLTGTGVVAFGDGAVEEVYPEWWGAKADGATNCATAIQAAASAHGRVVFGDGTYVVDNTTLYFNGSATLENWVITGTGYRTKIDFQNFTAGTYCMKVNEDAASAKVMAFPTSPRVTFRDMFFNAQSSTLPHFCKVNETAIAIENCRLNYFDNGVVTTAYCDGNRFENVVWGYCDGYFYYQNGNGDGAYLNQIRSTYVTTSGLAYLSGSGGCTISNCIAGKIYVYRSRGVIIEGNHIENAGASSILVNGSDVVIRNNWFYNNKGFYPIEINDGTSRYASSVVLDKNFYVTYLNDDVTDVRTADVRITALEIYGRISFRDNVCGVNYAGGSNYDLMGIKVTSAVALIQTALTAAPHLMSGDVVLQRQLVGAAHAWVVRPAHGLREVQNIDTPFISAISQGSVVSFSNLPADDYFYTVALYNDVGHTAKLASEATVTTTDANRVANINVGGTHKDFYLRIWRGTAAATYTAYADIPCYGEYIYLVDCGDMISGITWITAGVPAAPTANVTMNGYVMLGGKRVFHATAAPSSAEFTGVVGDIVWDSIPVSLAQAGWMCTVAGTPGTWVAMANLA